MTEPRWIGDLSTCFLLDDGWAFRLKVNRYQLKGRAGWQLPISVGEAIGVSKDERGEFTCPVGSLRHHLWIEGRDAGYVGGAIDLPLLHHGCRDGDLAFLSFRGGSYKLIPRKRNELEPDDALGSLLWHCGLDPNDEQLRADPWRRLARALGGAGDTPEAVAERLDRRHDKRLLALLEHAESQSKAASTAVWPPFWQYVLPDQCEEVHFILQRADGCVRVALGVMDATAQPPSDLTLGDGGVLWITLTPSDELERVDRLLKTPPAGLVPSARKRSWTRWMRADHAGRRAYLQDRHWRIKHQDGSWATDRGAFEDLRDALITLRDADVELAGDPPDRVDTTYPRNGLAFNAMIAEAIDDGLETIEGVPLDGYSATFAGGRTRTGSSLPGVLVPA